MTTGKSVFLRCKLFWVYTFLVIVGACLTEQTLVNLVTTLYGGYYTGAKHDKGSAFQTLALAAVAKSANPGNFG